MASNNIDIVIINDASVKRTFHALQLLNHSDKTDIRHIVKAPIDNMKRNSSINLTRQKSIKSGKLLRSLTTKSYARRGDYIATFGSDSKYSHAIDHGTGDRFTAAGKWTGAVGRATTNYKGRNYSFRLGFAQRAVYQVIPTIEHSLTLGLNKIINRVLIRENI